mmetsp:Transcript_23721/g.94074  ORF Transcript_23721/g.94074 Transcript_23721/m.94074 type:complete len:545 (+) Transcript_23721:65-1699(+)
MARALVAAALAAGAAAQQSSVFNIEIPSQLHKQGGGYRHQEAMFGAPTYGQTISQQLYYANSTLCTLPDSASGGYPPGTWRTPYVLMVDRGDCTFVTKVRNAQLLGASAAVIADNQCICGDADCPDLANCQYGEPIMADDGSGGDITIPAVLMWKADADEIKVYLICGTYDVSALSTGCGPPNHLTMVQAQLEYSLPAPDDRVEWELWTTSVDQGSEAFLISFRSTALALGQHMFFTPHYYTYNGTLYGCRNSDICGSLCTNGGRYCAPDPDRDFDTGLAGKDVVRENLRRTCVWKLYGGVDLPLGEDDPQRGVGETWWDYIGNFSNQCGSQEQFTNPDCIDKALSLASASPQLVDSCIRSSGGVEDNSGDNSMLDHEIKLKTENNIYVVPELIVNGKATWGALNVANVLSTICAGFSPGDEPQACECVDLAYAQTEYDQCLADARASLYVDPTTGNGGSYGSKSSKKDSSDGELIPWWGVFLLVVAIIVTMLIAGLVYWKKTQQQMRDQVRGILAEYMPLEDLGPSQQTATNAMHSHGLSIQA